jgi:hypothetical protein
MEYLWGQIKLLEERRILKQIRDGLTDATNKFKKKRFLFGEGFFKEHREKTVQVIEGYAAALDEWLANPTQENEDAYKRLENKDLVFAVSVLMLIGLAPNLLRLLRLRNLASK